MEHKRTYACVHLDNISHNLMQIKSVLRASTGVIAVVKANAYGHGAETVATFIENDVTAFAVSNIVEGIKLRKNGIVKPILILGYTPPIDALDLARYDLTQTVFGENYCHLLNAEAKKNDVRINAHIKIDSGMSRIGFTPRDVQALLRIFECENLRFSGIFTHFSSADGRKQEDYDFTFKQYERFISVVEELKNCGFDFDIVHCCNSAAAMKYTDMQSDCVRFGISLYGMTPDNTEECELDLKEAMTLKTIVSFVKKGRTGDSISYGRTKCLDKDTCLATVAMGYADGFPRRLSNKGIMYCNGTEMRIVGRVCMDQIVLECDERVSEGDEVDVFGYGTSQSISTFAQRADTINYEITCSVSPRVPRVYMVNNKIVKVIDTTP